MSKKRTNALSISIATKCEVSERDNGKCIFCGCLGRAEAHYIPRSKGGLGIAQNIVTVCRICHDKMDNSTSRQTMLQYAKLYLQLYYPNFNHADRFYRRKL